MYSDMAFISSTFDTLFSDGWGLERDGVSLISLLETQQRREVAM
jgi:hypothetical protein